MIAIVVRSVWAVISKRLVYIGSIHASSYPHNTINPNHNSQQDLKERVAALKGEAAAQRRAQEESSCASQALDSRLHQVHRDANAAPGQEPYDRGAPGRAREARALEEKLAVRAVRACVWSLTRLSQPSLTSYIHIYPTACRQGAEQEAAALRQRLALSHQAVRHLEDD